MGVKLECGTKGEFFIDNLLVRIHFIVVMIRWTGLAPRELEFPFPGSLTSTFLVAARQPPPHRHPRRAAAGQEFFIIDNLLVRIHFIIVMIRWSGLAPAVQQQVKPPLPSEEGTPHRIFT